MWDAQISGSRLKAFAVCGSEHWILRHKTDSNRFKVVPGNCHDRLCTPCNVHRTMLLKTNLLANCTRERHRFITLTLRHSHTPLSDQLDYLYRSFRRLRQRSFWKRHVTGGIALLEIEYNTTTGTWHPHFHIICTGRYMEKDLLSRLWRDVTKGSFITDIRRIPSRKRLVGYVLKYANKPLPPTITHEPAALREAIIAVHARRFVIPFGTWSKLHLLKDPDAAFWTLYAKEVTVEQDAYDGDPLASIVIAMLRTADPFTGEFFVDLEQIPPEI